MTYRGGGTSLSALVEEFINFGSAQKVRQYFGSKSAACRQEQIGMLS